MLVEQPVPLASIVRAPRRVQRKDAVAALAQPQQFTVRGACRASSQPTPPSHASQLSRSLCGSRTSSASRQPAAAAGGSRSFDREA
jgi:hypothetical protein